MKHAAGPKLITAFIFVSVSAAISVFATNPTAPKTTIPTEPPIAFAIFVEKETAEQ